MVGPHPVAFLCRMHGFFCLLCHDKRELEDFAYVLLYFGPELKDIISSSHSLDRSSHIAPTACKMAGNVDE